MVSPAYPQNDPQAACCIILQDTGEYEDMNCDLLGVWKAAEGAEYFHVQYRKNYVQNFRQIGTLICM